MTPYRHIVNISHVWFVFSYIFFFVIEKIFTWNTHSFYHWFIGHLATFEQYLKIQEVCKCANPHSNLVAIVCLTSTLKPSYTLNICRDCSIFKILFHPLAFELWIFVHMENFRNGRRECRNIRELVDFPLWGDFMTSL